MNKTGDCLQPGTKLWYVPSDRRETKYAREVVVERVARKWAYLVGGIRIDVTTLRVDGGKYPSPGTCYDSREAHERLVRANDLWRKLRESLGWSTGASPEQVIEAGRLLGVELI